MFSQPAPLALMVAAAAAAAPAAGMQQGADQAPARCGSSASATPQATQPTDTQHKAASARAAASSRCVKLAAGSKSVMAGGGGLTAAAAAASAAFVAAKLGLGDQLESALVKTPGLACLRDAEGRCCLHYAAGYGHEVSAASPAARLTSPACFVAGTLGGPHPGLWAVVWCCRSALTCCWTRAAQRWCVRATAGATWHCTWLHSKDTRCAPTTWQR